MFITGPDVIKTVTGEEVDFEELGGAMSHNTKSGVAHFAADDEDALPRGHALPHELPAAEQPRDAAAGHAVRRPACGWTRSSTGSSPTARTSPTTCATSSGSSSTTASSSRSTSTTRKNIVVRLRAPRTATRSASSATSPRSSRACSTSTPARRPRASCAPATRSTSRCSRFCDVPGFLPGTAQEWGGIIRHGAKLLYAYAEATVPKITVITRKAYGGAYDVMASKHLLADFNFAWPTRGGRGHGPRGRGEHHLPPRHRAVADARRAPRRSSSTTTRRASPTRTRRPSAATSTT